MKHKSQNNAAAVTNRLGKELSPYLLQHAGNPVDWYPWGDEAFARAREEDKPIFLSIGYSACHWCHVMERESFEDEGVASLLNDHFVSIKVDREELPDVDEVYMNAVQMTTGSGGWPLNVFLTPDLKPFFGGTYFPPQGRYGLPGFKDLLVRIARLWEESRQELLDSASQIVHALLANSNAPVGDKATPSTELITRAVAEMNRGFDRIYGGFGQSPKFPPSAALSLLMRCYHRTAHPDTLKMITLTLDRMAAGGIFDHIGGGFHRYSADEKWLVPHFEKMLYDNALLSKVYAEAYQLTRKERYRQVAEETFDYVLREMRDPEGGFYSSEDADSEGVEGKYYVWAFDEIVDALGDDAAFFAQSYGITREGNFESFNILSRQPGADEMEDRLSPMRLKLRQPRDARVHPGKDDKVIVAWNAMMIEGLVAGYKMSGEARYRDAAIAAGEFVWRRMRDENGRLLRIFRAGIAKQAAYLDDYANVVSAFEAIYEITFAPKWLEQADLFAEQMIHDFWDETSSAFFMTIQLPCKPAGAAETCLRRRHAVGQFGGGHGSHALIHSA